VDQRTDHANRLDLALVERGLAPTRSRARDLIRRGLVTVDGVAVVKPAAAVPERAILGLSGDGGRYVSRGAEKLLAALAEFGLSAEGRVALDVGASTGGFTQVLREAGARRVYAVDVGHGQLHESLRSDRAVVGLEGQDSRTLSRVEITEPVEAITADVSFISLTKALAPALDLAANGAWLVALVKPQFEVGPDGVGKGGIVRDAALRERAVETVRRFVEARLGWRVRGVIPSPIEGGSGNVEFLMCATYEP